MVLKIKVGHTPDSDDAFMFYGMELGLISTGDFEIEHVIEDIEKLNKRALNHELEITAISAHAYAYLSNYVILNSGEFRYKLWSNNSIQENKPSIKYKRE